MNQHYVPQSYLKNFSLDREKIYAFDKWKQKSFFTKIRNVAGEQGFYDFSNNVIESKKLHFMEEWFSMLETIQVRYLQHIQKKIDGIFSLKLNPKNTSKVYSTNIFTSDQRKDLAYIVAIQTLRTKESRNFLLEMFQTIEPLINGSLEQEITDIINQLKVLSSVNLEEDLVVSLKSYILDRWNYTVSSMCDEGLSIEHAKFILNNYEQAAQILNNHIWIVGINDTNKSLFTSDHPITRYPYLSSSGIASEGIEITFPLNNKIILIMRDRKSFQEYAHQDNKLFPLTRKDVEHYNTLQIYNSNRFVFCYENDFDLVRTICKQQPELCSRDRTRVRVTRIS